MSYPYRAALLAEIGVSQDAAALLAKACDFTIPDALIEPPSVFVKLLGRPAKIAPISSGVPQALLGCPAQFFSLNLWPHLYWVVSDDTGGKIPFGACFMNQADIHIDDFDPALVRIGLWTRHALEQFADRFLIHDGWSERGEYEYHFGSQRYLGGFTFNLLDSWRRL